MATQYDENIIQRFADTLYKQARTIEITYALVGFLVGFGGVWGGALATTNKADEYLVFGIVAGLLCLLVGLMLARPKAFLMRLQAQQALCFAQIERNTRR